MSSKFPDTGDIERGGNGETTMPLKKNWSGDVATACSSDGIKFWDLSGRKIVSYLTKGIEIPEKFKSADPGAGAGNVRTERVSGACQGQSGFRSRTWINDGTVVWHANGAANTLQRCNTGSGSSPSDVCANDDANACSGTYRVTISPPPAAVTECKQFHPVQIDLDHSFVARRTRREQSEQYTGWGRFALMPLSVQDMDDDGLVSGVLLPVRLSGTGSMTTESWVTSITRVDTGGPALRVVRQNVSFRLDLEDALQSPEGTSVALAVGNQFAPGLVQGYPYFVVENVEVEDLMALEVDLAWSVGSGAPTTPAAPGWVATTADLGCIGDQALTIRHDADAGRVSLELYGNPLALRTAEAELGEGGAVEFVFDEYGLEFAGSLTPGAQSATLQLETALAGGVEWCEPGTYTLQPE